MLLDNNHCHCTITLNSIRYICGKISNLLEIPIYFFNAEREIIFEYSYEYFKNPLYNKQEIFNDFLEIENKKKFLNIISNKYYENYFSIKVYNNQNFIGTLLVGPTLPLIMDETSIDSLIREFNIQIKIRKDLIDYYNNIAVLDYHKFMDVAFLLYSVIYNYNLDISYVEKISKSLPNFENTDINNFDVSESLRRKNSIFHHSINFEKGLLECIKEGDLEKLNSFTNSNIATGERGVHSRNPLRNEKNLLISFISIVSRTAAEGGLDWELSLSLCDFYILSAEECNSMEEINDLYAKMLSDYTKRVHKSKIGNYSSSVKKCKNFIFEHLYEKISLTQLADHLGMNSSYLSHLFKKEVGISISEYIQIEKITEAQKLIKVGEKSLSDIYIPLGFIDQSHFTKAFKKVTGITPKEYRLSVR